MCRSSSKHGERGRGGMNDPPGRGMATQTATDVIRMHDHADSPTSVTFPKPRRTPRQSPADWLVSRGHPGSHSCRLGKSGYQGDTYQATRKELRAESEIGARGRPPQHFDDWSHHCRSAFRAGGSHAPARLFLGAQSRRTPVCGFVGRLVTERLRCVGFRRLPSHLPNVGGART